LPDVNPLPVLWDIDHTLIENHGVNKETYALAFEMLIGRRAEHVALTEGRTEPEIMRGMLTRHGIKATPQHVAQMATALEDATLANARKLQARGQELPGTREALTVVGAIPGIVQSVLTGNIRPNAVIKLSAFGLDAFVDFEAGGYGDDDEARPRLVAVAQRRAAARYGIIFTKASTVLVGDTPRDVRAGLEGGARVVAVATGSDSADVLRAEGADVVLPDLRDTQAVVDAVKGVAGT
jgi:phosphoglycolate phosphatase-like HAD superfamily hydrolase